MSLDPYIDHQQRQGREGELRQAFEAWAESEHSTLSNVHGKYFYSDTAAAWQAFQAGHALAQQDREKSIQEPIHLAINSSPTLPKA